MNKLDDKLDTIAKNIHDSRDDLSTKQAYLKQAIKGLLLEAQQNGVAWAVGVIDNMHFGLSNIDGNNIDLDRTFKGIKNTIRDRYEAEVGVDPTPNYPIHVELAEQRKRMRGGDE